MKKEIVGTILKYLFSLLLTILVALNTENLNYLIAGILELAMIFSLSNILMVKKKVGQIVNVILLFFYNAQIGVMIFGNSYITMIMLTNIVSIKALSGKAVLYITSIILVLFFSLIPIKKITFTKRRMNSILFGCFLVAEIVFITLGGKLYSPLYGYVNLGIQYYEKQQSLQMIQEAANMALMEKVSDDVSVVDEEKIDAEENLTEETIEDSNHIEAIKAKQYKEGITNFREKDNSLTERPNIILIFTEGLSQNIITDERAIMPNIADLQENSLNFTSYYNHTFATYRGLIGQLYSGHQLADFDTNPLTSLQSVFSDLGYSTAFINTEPNNKEFTVYLENFGFDELIGDGSYQCNGNANSISDKDAYEILYEKASEKAKAEEPFFMSIYTFGTHTSLDSIDEKFGDGSDPVLNRFYDVDYQFGEFFEKVKTNSDFDDTIIIFTADHATYQDDSFNAAFPDYKRQFQCLDEIPLSIYYKGIEPEVIDVGGRNSLNLTPTILDYLDISIPNYFLGTSLFAADASGILETSYFDSYVNYTTKNDTIAVSEESEKEQVRALVNEYYVLKELIGKE